MDKREKLATCIHESWSNWMTYLFKKSEERPDGAVTIPAWAVERWKRQLSTAYANLPEEEKETDLAEADKMLAVLDDKVDPETCPHTNLDTFIEPHGDGWSTCKDCGKIFD